MIKRVSGGRGKKLYQWEKWFKSKKFTLKKGKDYECLTHSIAQQCRNAAFRYGYLVSIKVFENKIEVICKKDRR